MNETKLKNDNDLLKIGFVGDVRSGKKEIALKLIYEDIISNETIFDNEDFDKVVEIHNAVRKIKFEINFPYNFSEMSGFIFVFNGNDENSLHNLQEMLESQKNLNVKLDPCILIANYGNEEKKKKISETVLNLINDFNSEYFEVNYFNIKSI